MATCSRCGNKTVETDTYCQTCGNPTAPSPDAAGGPDRLSVAASPAKKSVAAFVLIAILAVTGAYAVARSANLVGRMHLVDRLQSPELKQQVQSGQKSPSDLLAEVRASDNTDHTYVIFSWILTAALVLGYRAWRSGSIAARLQPDARTRTLSKAAGILWLIAIVGQIARSVMQPETLSALHSSAEINLVSRVVMIPAVALSIALILRRERIAAALLPSV